MEIDAKLSRPTGFSEPSAFESNVRVLGFVMGKHRDGAGYDRSAECVLAVIADQNGRLNSVPVSWLSIDPTEIVAAAQP